MKAILTLLKVLVWIPLNLQANSFKIYNLFDFDVYLPSNLELISRNRENFLLLKTNDNIVFVIKKLQTKQNIRTITEEVISQFGNSEIIAKNGFHLLQRKTSKIQPSLKKVGCLEKKWNECIEILNHYYKKEEIFLKLVLINSYSLMELYNKIPQILKLQHDLINSMDAENANSNKKYLIYYINFTIFENPNNRFLILTITPEELYYKNEFKIQKLLSVTNIIPKTLNVKPHRDDFESNKISKSQNLLLAIDNSFTMKEKLNLLKNKINKFINSTKDFGFEINIGILSTENCKLKVPFSSKLETIIESEIFKIRNQFYESCIYQVEKFLLDPECNENLIVNRLSILCITDKSDSYFLLTKKKFNESENLFIKKQIPFFAIIPLNKNGKLGDCTGEIGNSSFIGSYENLEEANKNSVNYGILAEETNASISSICSSYYEEYLQKIAHSLIAKFSTYKLSKIPIPSTIRIWINEEEIDFFDNNNQSVYFDENENKIVIKNPLQENTPIKVEYLTFDY